MIGIVALQFDPKTNSKIRRFWDLLADSKIRVTYGNETPSDRLPPHVTLAAYEDESLSRYHEALNRLCAKRRPFPIRFHNLGVFPEKGVLFLAPWMSMELFNLHTDVLECFSGYGWPALKYDHLDKGKWAPHCTLVPSETPDKLQKAVGVCQGIWEPIEGIATGIGMHVPPATKDEFTCPFADFENMLRKAEV